MHKIWILKFYSHLQNKSHLLAKMCDILELEYFVKEVGAMFDGVARASVPMLARALVSQAIGSRLYLNHTLSPMVMYSPFHGFIRLNHGFWE